MPGLMCHRKKEMHPENKKIEHIYIYKCHISILKIPLRLVVQLPIVRKANEKHWI